MEYEAIKVGFFSSNRKKEFVMREEAFNQSKEKQVQMELICELAIF